MALSGKIPVFKKKIASFIAKEDGKISKESLIKTGVMAAVLSISVGVNAKKASSAVTCKGAGYYDCDLPEPDECCPGNHGSCSCSETTEPEHINSLSLSVAGNRAAGTHSHCVQVCHASHSSHNSHGSHSSHCAGWF